MAISLKNVDDRLRVLESNSGTSFAPDVSKKTKISTNWTATSDGWLVVDFQDGEYSDSRLYLDGCQMYRFWVTNAYRPDGSWTIPVGKGQKVTFQRLDSCYFIPVKLYYNLTAWLKGWWSKWL